MSETTLSRSIRSALTAAGAWVVRVPAGQYRVRGGILHCAEPGFPDLLCLSPAGFLEVKVGRAKLREEQVIWHDKAARHGLRCARVTSVAEALEVVSRWRREDERRTSHEQWLLEVGRHNQAVRSGG
jgi:hypothetical protein